MNDKHFGSNKERTANEKLVVASKHLMPPFRVSKDYLNSNLVAELLKYVAENESKFKDTTISEGIVDPTFRSSKRLPIKGELKGILKDKILSLVPESITYLRVTPFEPSDVELELVSHGDGAFYKQHIDTFTGKSPDTAKQRLLSAVYYFNSEPKAFTGGQLRLYAFQSAATEHKYVDIEPKSNSLIVFPSWASHEVRPVICPTKKFMDSRFSINAWVRRVLLGGSS